MIKKPIVGITMSTMKDSSGAFIGYERAFVSDDYVVSVYTNGGIPLTLPILEDDDILEFYVNTIDGLILSGGHDVNPHLYNEEIDQKTGDIYPRRDTFDINLVKKMLNKNKPILGICRGFQLLNVIFGGTLFQDLTLSKTKLIKHWQNQDCHMPVQNVYFSGDNFFTSLYGEKTCVNSWHHQILKDVAEDFEICGKTSDGVVEAFESKKHNIIGVQWHPEMMNKYDTNEKNIFSEFIKMINNHKKANA